MFHTSFKRITKNPRISGFTVRFYSTKVQIRLGTGAKPKITTLGSQTNEVLIVQRNRWNFSRGVKPNLNAIFGRLNYPLPWDARAFTDATQDVEVGHQAPVVRRLDNAILWINLYTVDSAICFAITYPLDSDLSIE